MHTRIHRSIYIQLSESQWRSHNPQFLHGIVAPCIPTLERELIIMAASTSSNPLFNITHFACYIWPPTRRWRCQLCPPVSCDGFSRIVEYQYHGCGLLLLIYAPVFAISSNISPGLCGMILWSCVVVTPFALADWFLARAHSFVLVLTWYLLTKYSSQHSNNSTTRATWDVLRCLWPMRLYTLDGVHKMWWVHESK